MERGEQKDFTLEVYTHGERKSERERFCSGVGRVRNAFCFTHSLKNSINKRASEESIDKPVMYHWL